MSCLPPLTETVRYVCAPHDVASTGPDHNLCHGVKELRTLPCSELTDVDSLERVITRIGLKPHNRGALLYGPRGARNMVSSGGMSQHPMQLAPALLRLSKLGLRSYLELGVDAGWTLAVVTAFLQRFGLADATGVDLTFERISSTTLHILRNLRVALVSRDALTSIAIDLCFIDASHALRDLVVDFSGMQPRCTNMMFHDVSDFDCWRNADGGPARFWAHLKTQVPRARWTEFVMQPDIYPPTFGIGLLFGGPRVTLNATAWRNGGEPASARDITRRSLKYCLGGIG